MSAEASEYISVQLATEGTEPRSPVSLCGGAQSGSHAHFPELSDGSPHRLTSALSSQELAVQFPETMVQINLQSICFNELRMG